MEPQPGLIFRTKKLIYIPDNFITPNLRSVLHRMNKPIKQSQLIWNILNIFSKSKNLKNSKWPSDLTTDEDK